MGVQLLKWEREPACDYAGAILLIALPANWESLDAAVYQFRSKSAATARL